jgi:hypothetical protein
MPHKLGFYKTSFYVDNDRATRYIYIYSQREKFRAVRKKALKSAKKAFYLDFQIFPEKIVLFLFCWAKKKLNNLFLKFDY